MSDNTSNAAGSFFYLGDDNASQGKTDFDDSHSHMGPWTTTKDFDWEGEGTWQATQFDENGNNVGYISIDQLELEDVGSCWQSPNFDDANGQSEYVKFFDPEDEDEESTEGGEGASNEQEEEEEHEMLLDNEEEENEGIVAPNAPNAQNEIPILYHDVKNGRVLEFFKSTGKMRYWDTEIKEYIDCFVQEIQDLIFSDALKYLEP